MFVPALKREAFSEADLIVEPVLLQGRLLFKVFPLAQMRLKEEEGVRREDKEGKRERCNLSPIDWLHL